MFLINSLPWQRFLDPIVGFPQNLSCPDQGIGQDQSKDMSRRNRLLQTNCSSGTIPPTINKEKPAMRTQPVLNVVVYRNPGPEDSAIETHTQAVVALHSTCGTGGGLGYVTLVESDFDRLWNGVNGGDVLGTAYSVLAFLGPKAQQFIGRPADFLFGWVGGTDEEYGNVLLLQIIPRAHLLAHMN